MHKLYLILICVLSLVTSNCQINENFNDSDLSSWSGDIGKFIVNEDLKLQLSDTAAGSATIHTQTTYGDSTVWTMDINLDFSPSTSNNLQILLAVDNVNLAIGNGYILEIGENGSDDAIRLIEIINGNPAIIGSGIAGSVGSAFDYTIELTRDSNDNWILKSKPVDDILFTQEFSIQYLPKVDFSTLNQFGYVCEYSATRADKFFFDNIVVEDLKADVTPPQVTDVVIISANELRISFDEAVDELSAAAINNYTFDPDLGINIARIDDNFPFIINLILDDPLLSGEVTTLTISGITDVVGNVMIPTSYELRLTESIEAGDLLINEILFDPYVDGEDFLEVINISEKFLNLNGLIIENATNQQSEMITSDIILLPNELIAFSEDIDFLLTNYEPIGTALLYSQDLPAFNNSDGNVTLKVNDGNQDITLDTYDYDEDQHLGIISDTEGISLERISITSETNNPSNWTSGSEVTKFATPGYENSARIDPTSSSDDEVSLAYKVFSPNSDSYRDNLILNYNLNKSGYIANVTIYDDKGRSEIAIAENILIGASGFFRWDGTSEDGVLLSAGMYIVLYEFFHTDGSIIKGKKVCVLGQKLN